MDRLFLTLMAALVAVGVMPAGPAASPQTDLDAFMARVLARRDENWKKRQEFILDEKELVEVRGPGGIPLWGQRREYSWYIQEGFFVRSPTKVDGVELSDAERRGYEARYLKRAQERAKRKAEEEQKKAAVAADPAAAPGAPPETLESLVDQARQPGFIDAAYFLEFTFEQGKYAFVGRETFEGMDVLKVEYYPERLFTHEADTQKKRAQEGRRDRGEDAEAALERMMNKVSLVTLWIEPKAHQIVKYTFDNVNLDFLPAAWLVRLDDLEATMTMSQPFPDVWLPRDVEFHFGAMLAIGAFDVVYKLNYFDYREAKTSGRIRREGGRP